MTIDDSMTLVTMVRSDGSMAPFWLGPREPPDYPQPLEYPCNCTRCRNVTDDRETYHDGEVTWWRCAVCGGHFELEDMELLEDDEQACLRCARPHLLAPAAALAALSTGQL